MDRRTLALIATVMDACAGPPGRGPGHPPAETVRVLATSRQFLREGRPWRGLRATADAAGGSTLRLRERARAGDPRQQAHAVLVGGQVARRRSRPDPPQPRGPGRARRRPHRAAPDRPGQARDQVPPRHHGRRRAGGRRGDGGQRQRHRPVRAPVPDRLRRPGPHPRRVRGQEGYDAEDNRATCRGFGAEPRLHKRGRPRGSGLGEPRWPVERSNAWVLEDKRLALRYDRLGFIVESLLHAACLLLVAGRLAREL